MLFQLASTLLGIWLMAAPAALRYGDPAAFYDRILGPAIAAVAMVAIFEVTRGFRWLNLPAGLALVALPWLAGYEISPLLNSTIVGLAVLVLTVPRGRIVHRVGGGWRTLTE